MAKSALAHRLYKRIRPALDNLGVLQIARRLFPKSLRENVAARLGLSEFNIYEASGIRRPRWERHDGPRLKPRFDGINYVTDLRAHLGLSQYSRAVVESMRKADIPVAYTEFVHDVARASNTVLTDDLETGNPYSINVIDMTQVHSRIKELPPRLFKDKYIISTWFWELNQFPEEWLPIFDYTDEIWAASGFTHRVISNVSTVPVVRIPAAINVQLPDEYSRADFDLPEDRFIFFYSFDPRSSIARKNPFGFIEAFRRAFGQPGADGPLLVLKTFALQSSDKHDLDTDLRDAVDSVGGRLIQTNLSRLMMNALIACADCYVSPHRAEGFGLGLAESMFLGKPVIGTAYSGNIDFMNVNNSYFIRYHMREITEDDHKYQPAIASLYRKGFTWAEPDLDHLAAQMTHVYENQDEARRLGLRAQADIHTDYSPQAVGEIIKARLSRITQESDS